MEPLALDDHERIVFFTGAGLSAASGVPTYRGRGGIWHQYDYGTYACQRAFDADPAKVWDFHDIRRGAVAAVEPNEAHRIIARVQAARAGVSIVTQNIDGLQQRAGGVDVIELHGSLWRVRCDCPDSPQEDRTCPVEARRCARCGAWRRPDIVWFEDPMPVAPIERAMDALLDCDVLLSIGTSGVVYPAAQMPQAAKAAGARLLEINPEATPVSGWYDTRLRCEAVEALRDLFPDFADAGPAGS